MILNSYINVMYMFSLNYNPNCINRYKRKKFVKSKIKKIGYDKTRRTSESV